MIRLLSERAILVAVGGISTADAPLGIGIVPADGPAGSRVEAAAVGPVLFVIMRLAFGVSVQVTENGQRRMIWEIEERNTNSNRPSLCRNLAFLDSQLRLRMRKRNGIRDRMHNTNEGAEAHNEDLVEELHLCFCGFA